MRDMILPGGYSNSDRTGGMGLAWYFFIIISMAFLAIFTGVFDKCGLYMDECGLVFIILTSIFYYVINNKIFKNYGVEHLSLIFGILITFVLFYVFNLFAG